MLESASPGLEREEERAARRAADARLVARLEAEGIEAFVAHWERLPLFASQRSLSASILDAQRRRRLRNDPGSLAASLRGLGTGALPSFWKDLPSLRIPTLVLAGELKVVPGAGHNVHLERPDAWIEAVITFLQDS